MEEKLYQNKEWLYHQYIKLNKSSREIGQECNCYNDVICRWLRKFNIKKDKSLVYKTRQKKIEATNLKNLGVKNQFQSDKIKDKIKENNLKQHGVEYYTQTDEFKEKSEKTNLKKYKSKNYIQSENFKEKSEKTNLDKYSSKNYIQSEDFKNKTKKTNLKKYHSEYYVQTDSFKNKSEKTNMKKLGVKNPGQSEIIKQKIKKTNLNKYGVECSLHSEKCKNQIKQKFLNNFGVDNPFKSKEIQNKIKQQNLENIGVEYYSQTKEFKEKCYKTKKKNNSFHTSKPEKVLLIQLKEIFPSIETQYKDKRYPFACDYYIKELDLFIELNHHWTHGKEPYHSVTHQEVCSQWLNKSKTSKFYKNALNVWTKKDPEKQKIAKQNNLNYLAIYERDYKKGLDYILKLIKDIKNDH